MGGKPESGPETSTHRLLMLFDRLPKRWRTDDDEATRRALGWLAEMVAQPIALVMNDGRAQCNAAMNRMLGEEVEANRRQLIEAIDQLADQMSRAGDPTRNGGSVDERDLRVRTSGQRYMLEPVFAPFEHTLAGVIRLHRSRT